MELGYMAQADLEPEFVVYAAWDVEPLHRYPYRPGFLKNLIQNLITSFSFIFTIFSV